MSNITVGTVAGLGWARGHLCSYTGGKLAPGAQLGQFQSGRSVSRPLILSPLDLGLAEVGPYAQ